MCIGGDAPVTHSKAILGELGGDAANRIGDAVISAWRASQIRNLTGYWAKYDSKRIHGLSYAHAKCISEHLFYVSRETSRRAYYRPRL